MHLIDQELNCMLRGQFDQGWSISEQLQAMGKDGIPDPSGKPSADMWLRHSFNRGWFLLQQGKFQEGCQLLETGRFLNVYGSGHLKTTQPIWHGQSLDGKTVILSLEGGFGDEIIHARFATSLKKLGARVLLAADPKLHSVFSRIDGVDKVISRAQVELNPHDYWIPGFSAGWLCGHTYENMPNAPYLTALPELVAQWKQKLTSDRVKIGIRWSGNPEFEHQQFRNFPAEFLINLSQHTELQLYSLQRDNDTKELPAAVIDLQHDLKSWEDTAAAMMNLDLVITSCTSVAHMAAALGKPTWVMTPILPYHTWAYNAPANRTSPWYSSVYLYRQSRFADWTDTFNVLYQDIKEKFNLAGPVLSATPQAPSLNMLNKDKSTNSSQARQKTPAAKTKQNNKQSLFFMAGLPNSGGNVVSQLLMQNSSFHCSTNSGMSETVGAILQNWEKHNFSVAEQNKFDVLSAALFAYNRSSNATVVIDKNRLWVTRILQLEAILQQPVKIICPVRNPAEILSAYELARKDKILAQLPADNKLGSNSTIATRCYHYSKPTGEMGLAHTQLRDALTQGLANRLLFVDYVKFCNEPSQQLKRIYDFLGVEYFENHDVSGVKRQLLTPIEIIGFDLYQQYNSQIFWQSLT